VILCDTGPLVALIDQSDANYARCLATLKTLPATPFITTWPCLTEAMYLLFRVGGLPAQDELWSFLVDGLVRLHLPEQREWQRLRSLMQDYSDSPMDLADASLVAAGEQLAVRHVFTLDRHFHAYRMNGQHPFEVIP